MLAPSLNSRLLEFVIDALSIPIKSTPLWFKNLRSSAEIKAFATFSGICPLSNFVRAKGPIFCMTFLLVDKKVIESRVLKSLMRSTFGNNESIKLVKNILS